jgi:hypothetical protein
LKIENDTGGVVVVMVEVAVIVEASIEVLLMQYNK